jgi:hypothetical protein
MSKKWRARVFRIIGVAEQILSVVLGAVTGGAGTVILAGIMTAAQHGLPIMFGAADIPDYPLDMQARQYEIDHGVKIRVPIETRQQILSQARDTDTGLLTDINLFLMRPSGVTSENRYGTGATNSAGSNLELGDAALIPENIWTRLMDASFVDLEALGRMPSNSDLDAEAKTVVLANPAPRTIRKMNSVMKNPFADAQDATERGRIVRKKYFAIISACRDVWDAKMKVLTDALEIAAEKRAADAREAQGLLTGPAITASVSVPVTSPTTDGQGKKAAEIKVSGTNVKSTVPPSIAVDNPIVVNSPGGPTDGKAVKVTAFSFNKYSGTFLADIVLGFETVWG